MERLGGVRCRCCGESIYEFLAFDHIHGGGNKDRGGRLRSTAYTQIRLWLYEPDIEQKIQVLCHNCNMAKGRVGICPHALMTPQGIGPAK